MLQISSPTTSPSSFPNLTGLTCPPLPRHPSPPQSAFCPLFPFLFCTLVFGKYNARRCRFLIAYNILSGLLPSLGLSVSSSLTVDLVKPRSLSSPSSSSTSLAIVTSPLSGSSLFTTAVVRFIVNEVYQRSNMGYGSRGGCTLCDCVRYADARYGQCANCPHRYSQHAKY
jgi:hypothetical protein